MAQNGWKLRVIEWVACGFPAVRVESLDNMPVLQFFIKNKPFNSQLLIAKPEYPILFDLFLHKWDGNSTILNFSGGVYNQKLQLDRNECLLLHFQQLMRRFEMFRVEDTEILGLEQQQSRVEHKSAFTLLIGCYVIDRGACKWVLLGYQIMCQINPIKLVINLHYNYSLAINKRR